MLTTREIYGMMDLVRKNRDWNNKELLNQWREAVGRIMLIKH